MAVTALAYGVGQPSAVYSAEAMMATTFIDHTDLLDLFKSANVIDSSTKLRFENIDQIDTLAVPGPVMGAGLPVL